MIWHWAWNFASLLNNFFDPFAVSQDNCTALTMKTMRPLLYHQHLRLCHDHQRKRSQIQQLVPLAVQRVDRSGLQRSMPDSTSATLATPALATADVPAAASSAAPATTSIALAPAPDGLRVSAYPTEERVRQTQQEKERKAAGASLEIRAYGDSAL